MTIYNELINHTTKLAVIGLGYVGLQVAVHMSKHYDVIGYDINKTKIDAYKKGIDITGDIDGEQLRNCNVDFTADESKLANATLYIIAVPTPVRKGNVPDLYFIEQATLLVARYLKKGDIVVYESTVYPGVTEEVCLPILEQNSGLKVREEFKIGYSPERINPGDRIHTFDKIIKIVSGIDEESAAIIGEIYETVVSAGIYYAPSIRVAEAAKVVENAQRDVNIAFMNELAVLFSQMNLNTKDVLAAAGTKWNFLNFTPGLVGGHCISIDPYYLTYKAEDEGYPSKLILTSRHINDSMGKFIANQMIKAILRTSKPTDTIKVCIMGVAYKENSPDIRNSKVVDVVSELMEYGIRPYIYDPIANVKDLNIGEANCITNIDEIKDMDLIAITVPHHQLLDLSLESYLAMFKNNLNEKLFFDIKGVFNKQRIEIAGMKYWSL